LGGKLAGALVQLRSHFGGLFGGTTEGDQDFGEFGDFHAFCIRACRLEFTLQRIPHAPTA
jgi:hypothetical protein